MTDQTPKSDDHAIRDAILIVVAIVVVLSGVFAVAAKIHHNKSSSVAELVEYTTTVPLSSEASDCAYRVNGTAHKAVDAWYKVYQQTSSTYEADQELEYILSYNQNMNYGEVLETNKLAHSTVDQFENYPPNSGSHSITGLSSDDNNEGIGWCRIAYDPKNAPSSTTSTTLSPTDPAMINAINGD